MSDVVTEVVERLWPGRTATVEPLSGGITNANFKVVLEGEQVVVRVPGKNTALLGIDRISEVAANRAAAAIGVAPEIVAVDEATGCIVTRFLDGRPIPMAELATEPTLGSVIATLVRVHASGSVEVEFDHFQVIRSYHEEARHHGVSEPFDYGEASDVLARIEIARPFRPIVLGHNDLLNANLLDDGSIRILDWEYAGMADPYFDLANFSVNNELGAERDESVLGHYFGSVDDSKLATLALMKLVSELREAMWGVVQLAISELDVDFVGYATERGEHFGSLLATMELGRLLDQVARG
ncbi:MAG TPA: choline/ethanolamine kinase family protein [Acidimicrobiales bacterium]|nr:choline/ethanolamine kinase family protein [Acidimicrobiales bacterium]